jgi:hypothetical protein
MFLTEMNRSFQVQDGLLKKLETFEKSKNKIFSLTILKIPELQLHVLYGRLKIQISSKFPESL